MAVALVTGGAGGIGEGIVRRLAAGGHRVAVGWASNEERAQRLVDDLAAEGAEALAVRCDTADRDVVDECFRRVEREWSPPLVLVNNGGIRITKAFAKFTPEEWDRIVDVNLNGVFSTIHRALPAMISARWGRIVNISSPAGSTAYPGAAGYGASKAATNQLTRILALEVARKGITVNAVSPGFVLTDMTAGMGDEAVAEILAGQAAPRPVEPDEVGAMVAFLAGDDAAMVSGQDILVDGGGPLIVRPPARPARAPEGGH